MELAEVGAPGGKKVTQPLLCHECLCSPLCPLFALRVNRWRWPVLNMMCARTMGGHVKGRELHSC